MYNNIIGETNQNLNVRMLCESLKNKLYLTKLIMFVSRVCYKYTASGKNHLYFNRNRSHYNSRQYTLL